MSRFFTSDLHLGHVNIIDFCDRPFKDVNHMKEMLIRNWNETVTPEDEVYVLGDFAMGRIDETLPLATRLNGEKFLFCGNHDRCWYGNKNYRDWISRYEDVGFHVDVMGPHDAVQTEIANIKVLMSHFPYIGDSHTNDRYLAYRPVDRGLPLLHGHTHSTLEYDPQRPFQIHVGVDAWNYRPVAEDVLADFIKSLYA